MPADLIGARYQLHREVARTPSVAVYEAEDRRTGTPTGIAVALDGGRRPHHGRRLLGRRLDRTAHPHVVPIQHRGKDGNQGFVAFRRPPRTLATELATAPYPPNRVAQMGLDLSSALAVLHRAGIRLGSLHPGHVGIDADGAVRLSPWPLAAPPGGWGGQGAWSPPDVVAGSPPSVAGDLWSLGAVLLSSLVGSGPGQLSTAATQDLADRLRHDANPVLVEAIGRSMVADPAARFASARGMASALSGGPVTRRQFTAAGVPRLSAGTRRLALASTAVVGVLSATTVGIGLTSLGSSIASGGGGDHPPLASALPPAATGHPVAPAGSNPGPGSAPKGVVAMGAVPPPTTAVARPSGHVRSATATLTPVLASADSPAPGVSPTPTPTTSASTTTTTTAPTTTTTTTPTTTTTTTPTTTSTTTSTTTTTAPSGSGSPINATHDHGGGGGGGRSAD